MRLNLKMIPVDQIDIPIECCHSKIEFYSNAIKRHKALRNPLTVLKSGGKYVLLDEPEILMALISFDAVSVPAQLITDDRQISIVSETYYDDLNPESINQFISQFPRDLFLGQDLIDNRIFAEINLADSQKFFCSFKDSGDGVISPNLFDFIMLLKSQGRLIGQTGFGETGGGNIRSSVNNSFVRIVNVEWDHIRKTIAAGLLLPSEIFSFEFIGRVLGIDFPLDVLISNSDINQKSLFLNELLNLRQSSRLSRYYGNGVYIMNY